jgi:predicted amidohydrolase
VSDRVLVGVAQWLPLPGEKEHNAEIALGMIDELSADCDLVVLPEYWSCGYDPESFHDDVPRCAEPLDGPLMQRLCRLARERRVHLVPGSMPERDGGRYFNTTVLIGADGTVVGRHRKAHMYGSTEQSCITPGDSLTVCTGTPFGTLGLSICFDGDFPETARALRARGARLVINPSAYDHPAEAWWERLYPAHALANQQHWVLSNHAGSHRSISFFGRSRVISPQGDVVAEAARAEPGTTPPPDTLVVELPLGAQHDAGLAETDVLFSQRRLDLTVQTVSESNPTGVSA